MPSIWIVNPNVWKAPPYYRFSQYLLGDIQLSGAITKSVALSQIANQLLEPSHAVPVYGELSNRTT